MDPMIEVLDTRLLELIPDDTQIERIAGGFTFTEGPLWRGDHLIFSDIPNNRIVRWDEGPEGPSVSTFRTPSGRSNGLTLDKQGRLLACEHLNRRVSITQADGTVETRDLDGSSHTVWADGTWKSVRVRPDGTIVESHSDGSRTAIQPDGTRAHTNSFGQTSSSVQLGDDEDGGSVTTYEDGSEYLDYGDGRRTWRDASGFTFEVTIDQSSGDRITTASDGSRRVERPDGSFEHQYSDGSVDTGTIDEGGNLVIRSADGTTAVAYADGSESWTESAALEAIQPRHTDGVLAVTSWPQEGEFGPAWARFVTAYEGHFQQTLRSPTAALGYDAARLLLTASRLGGGLPSGMLRALREIRDFAGATGVLSVVDDRIVRRHYPVRIESRRLVPLSP